jgi:Ca2+-binding RTX toxin-like protein
MGSAGDAQGDTLNGIENLTGGNGDDTLQGSNLANVIHGNTGYDYVVGLGGDDLLYGDAGNDSLIGGAGADRLSGGDGFDTADYSASSAAVTVRLSNGTGLGGDAQGDTLLAIERVVGSAFNDTLIGSTAPDYLDGGSGDDTLTGGAGGDHLTGGTGNDTFVLNAGDANGDIITDFAGNGAAAGDAITFSGYGTAADDAHIVQLDATHWQIVSADGLIHDTITLANGATLDPSDYLFGP